MAFTCGFFNSKNGDRKYNAEQMASIFDGLIKDGVYDTVGDIFAVTPGTGMQVLVGSGRAWFDHTWNNNDAPYPLAITAADVSLPRYDAVVLETNHSDTVRTNRLRVLTGTPARNPIKPTMTSTANVKQHPLAYIKVTAGATAITQSMIQVVVGTSECPFVTGIIDTAQIDALFQQWNGEFNEWFDNLKAQLSDNVVANLQGQIDQKVAKADVATTADIKAGTSTTKWVTPKGLKESVKANGIYDETTGKYVKLHTKPTYGFERCPDAAFSKYGLQFKNIIINENVLHYFWYEIANVSNQQLNLYIRAVNLDTFAFEDHLITNTIYNSILGIKITEGSFDPKYGCQIDIVDYNSSNHYACIRFDWGYKSYLSSNETFMFTKNYVYQLGSNRLTIINKDGSSSSINYSNQSYGYPFISDYNNDKIYLQKNWAMSNNNITLSIGSISVNGAENPHTISGNGASFKFINSSPCLVGFDYPYMYIFIPQCPKILRINVNDWTSNMNDIVSSENTSLLSHSNGGPNSLWLHGESLDGKIMYTDYGNSGSAGSVRFVYFDKQTLTNVILGYGVQESFRDSYTALYSKHIIPTNKNGWYAGGVFVRSDDLKILSIAEPITTLPDHSLLNAAFLRPLSKVGYLGDSGYYHHVVLGRIAKYVDIAGYIDVNGGTAFTIRNDRYYLVKSNLDTDFRSPEVLV